MDATHAMTGVEYLEHTRPMVYAWKRKDEYLYIGCCVSGLTRIFNTKHHAIRRDKIRKEDTIVWMYFDNKTEMSQTEIKLIREHNPKYNKNYKLIRQPRIGENILSENQGESP